MKRSLLALALVAIVPFAAQPDDKLSYTYVEGAYLKNRPRGGKIAGIARMLPFGPGLYSAIGSRVAFGRREPV